MQLKQIHAYALKNGIDHTKFLIDQILQIPNIPYARRVFDLIPVPTLFLYNKLIQAYSSNGPYNQCFTLYAQMCLRGFSPNQHSFTFLFAACPSIPSLITGQILHAQFVKSGFESNIFAVTALVDMYAKLGLLLLARRKLDEMQVTDVAPWNSIIAGYAKAGDMEAALGLFRLMPAKNVISWTAMISGYSQNGQYTNALDMFLRMEREKDVRPNQVTIASVLPACANLGALEVGERIEIYARENKYLSNLFVSNALLEMHARCGRIDKARHLFDEIRIKRNLCSWNSMIMGLATHGRCLEALELFQEMLRERISPDDVTFVAVLLACTHGGMVVRGRQLFESMEQNFSITPKLEHYGCMVDLLGRAGELGEAYNLIQSMPMKPDSVVWGALLGACSFYGHVDIAEKAAGFLFELEPWNPGNYVILSNIYASAGQWDDVARLRISMKGSGITKAAGYSFIEEGGIIHKFIVEDRSHPRRDEIYALLDAVYTKMKKFHGSMADLDSETEELCMMESI